MLDRAIVWLIALGIVLPSMHQSSLGSLYLLARFNVHSFWMTPWLPLMFLLSCWIMGYAAVVKRFPILPAPKAQPHRTQAATAELGTAEV